MKLIFITSYIVNRANILCYKYYKRLLKFNGRLSRWIILLCAFCHRRVSIQILVMTLLRLECTFITRTPMFNLLHFKLVKFRMEPVYHHCYCLGNNFIDCMPYKKCTNNGKNKHYSQQIDEWIACSFINVRKHEWENFLR